MFLVSFAIIFMSGVLAQEECNNPFVEKKNFEIEKKIILKIFKFRKLMTLQIQFNDFLKI